MATRPIKSPRRKAKQARSLETVDALLEAAARVLEKHGYAAATTNRIAEVAGTSIGTLYEYFANKEEVYDALIKQEIERLVAAIRSEPLDPEASLDEKLTQLLIVAMRAMRHGPEFIRSLEQVPGAIFRRRLLAARESVFGFARQILEVHRSELRVTDLDLAAIIVVSAAEGIASNISEELFDERLAEEAATLMILYLKGARTAVALPPTRP